MNFYVHKHTQEKKETLYIIHIQYDIRKWRKTEKNGRRIWKKNDKEEDEKNDTKKTKKNQEIKCKKVI